MDSLKRRCGCGAILGLREGCAACAGKERERLEAKRKEEAVARARLPGKTISAGYSMVDEVGEFSEEAADGCLAILERMRPRNTVWQIPSQQEEAARIPPHLSRKAGMSHEGLAAWGANHLVNPAQQNRGMGEQLEAERPAKGEP